MRLSDKTVIVPGGSRPIGRAIARRFAREGAQLILPWYDWPESVAEMEKEFGASGATILAAQCDLRDRESVQMLFDEVKTRFGQVDYLVNNIERGGMPVVHGSYDHEHNRQQWNLELETTLKAKWNLYQCAKDLMTGPSCSVVNISSIAALTGRSGPAACFFNDGYSAANRAVQSLTESWARESAPGIRVNELMIGLVTSRHGDNTRGWTVLSDEEKESLLAHTLLSRLGTPEEVADTVFFLAVEATYMTGSVIRMDGGYLLGGDTVPPMPPGIL